MDNATALHGQVIKEPIAQAFLHKYDYLLCPQNIIHLKYASRLQ